ncbi:MAG TPA: polysaccharide deacetylase family protein, partial [Candidatus Saccharimonadales bacterium]|nr:polysaccharide deacetylase family protein [Candidatus Saccharimonadales bacterium]
GGPSYITPKILDTLKVYKAKATFFEVGAQAKLYPSIARRTVREGHVVGMMGENHRNLLAAPVDIAKQDLQQGSETVRLVTGTTPRLARAPYGAMTTERAKELGMSFVAWSVGSDDGADVSEAYRSVMANVHEGVVVAASEVSDTTAAAYTRVIPELIKKGYKLVTVPELMGSAPAPDVFGEL